MAQCVFSNKNTDLVFDNGVIEVVHKIAHVDRAPFILRVSCGSGLFR